MLTVRSRTGTRGLIGWFVAGTATGVFLIWTQVGAVGGLAGLLQVGEASELRPLIESELGSIPLTPGGGHDGQISYAIGLDLSGDVVPDALDDVGYRYRRIGLPALASAGGVLRGEALLWGMVVLSCVGVGLSTAAVRWLASDLGLPAWVVIGVLGNPGVWLGARLLTPDALGLGLALSGVALTLGRRNVAAGVVFLVASLTKDQFLLVAGSAAALAFLRDDVRAAATVLGPPAAGLAAWGAFLSARAGGAFSPRGNLDLPLAGIVESATTAWPVAPDADRVLAWVTLLVLAVTAVSLLRARRLELHVLTWPWVALALVSSSWVWDFGNNAARAFAIISAFGAMAVGSLVGSDVEGGST